VFSSEEGVGILPEESLIFPLAVFSVYYTAERFYSVSYLPSPPLFLFLIPHGSTRYVCNQPTPWIFLFWFKGKDQLTEKVK
jgi:hypothetical protein